MAKKGRVLSYEISEHLLYRLRDIMEEIGELGSHLDEQSREEAARDLGRLIHDEEQQMKRIKNQQEADKYHTGLIDKIKLLKEEIEAKLSPRLQ